MNVTLTLWFTRHKSVAPAIRGSFLSFIEGDLVKKKNSLAYFVKFSFYGVFIFLAILELYLMARVFWTPIPYSPTLSECLKMIFGFTGLGLLGFSLVIYLMLTLGDLYSWAKNNT